MNLFGYGAHDPLDAQAEEIVPPEYVYSAWTEYLYTWMSPLICVGSTRTLELDDIPQVPTSQSSRETEYKLSVLWEAEKQNSKSPSLIKATIWAFFRHWLFSVINCIGFVGITTIQPYFITKLLEYISNGSANAWGITSGFGIAGFLAAISFILTVVVNNAIYHLYLFAMAIRSALIAILFKKCIAISHAAKGKMSIGETITLMSVDVERVWMGCLLFIWMIMAPAFLILAMILLYLEMGYASTTVMVFMLVLIYYQELVSTWIGDTRASLVTLTVERTKLTNEALQGIRVVKMFAWEDAIVDRIDTVRRKELSLLKRYLTLKVINTVRNI
jgi:ABC-type multidrug transport system fused ATPase/permease subunit